MPITRDSERILLLPGRDDHIIEYRTEIRGDRPFCCCIYVPNGDKACYAAIGGLAIIGLVIFFLVYYTWFSSAPVTFAASPPIPHM